MGDPATQVVYWRRELPPLSEAIEGVHEVEADSPRIRNDLAHRTELWQQCYAPLLAETERRTAQEVARLGGSCAHILEEHVIAKIDDSTGEFWLRGRFCFAMYRHEVPS
jgi:hypothetical protein